jgi:chemotaxis protein MotB
MSSRSLRYRSYESNNIWPGFVDVLATLLIVIIFVLMVFTVSQIYLSDAISGKDKALQNLRNQINQLSKILVIETQDKEIALSSLIQREDDLLKTQTDLQNQEAFSKSLQTDIAKIETKIFVQDQNIIALSEQIKNLLGELRIVAKVLEVYEGADIVSLNTEGLGERINKALTTRINQLNQLNADLGQSNILLEASENNLKNKINDLDKANNQLNQLNADLGQSNILLEASENNLKNKINDLDKANIQLAFNEIELKDKVEKLNNLNNSLTAINDSLGLGDAELLEQLAAIQKKNEQLELSQRETQMALDIIDQVNQELVLKDESLQEQISQYQEIANDLLLINDSLGLEDASLLEQLDSIRLKNSKLAELNLNLVEKDNAIFSLRGKILELNNILSLSEEVQISQKNQISNLNQSLKFLEAEKEISEEKSKDSIAEMKLRSSETFKQVEFLSNEIVSLKEEINQLNKALESNEELMLAKELKIEVLGERLNKALTSKIFELQKYRSEFFGKLQSILGDRDDIKIVGDRFIFESELLFDSASANLQLAGMEKLKQIGLTLKETTNDIPSDINWIIQVEGHSDNRPIKTLQYPSNWELSTARANSVLKILLDLGFAPNRLSAAGYGEFYPISAGDSAKALQENRRIELKLTSR